MQSKGSIHLDDTKRAGQLFLEAYAERQEDYDANFADPFIRAAVAHYHPKAKELIGEDNADTYQKKKHEILLLEATRGQFYLHDSQLRDYLETLGELFEFGEEKFQRPKNL
ncbi:hypothetical protein AAVH_14693 [Aphelenchoides avenae]|nr:hypothetical protein AAVH_14693 [Aphelenchus avenae]